MPDFGGCLSGALALFYGEIADSFLRGAQRLCESAKGRSFSSLIGSAEQYEDMISVRFDVYVCLDGSLVCYRRLAQVWDEKGRILSRRAFRKRLPADRLLPAKSAGDCFYIGGGREKAAVNSFRAGAADGLRRSELKKFIAEI